MNWQTFLTGSAGAAIFAGIFKLIEWILNRKAAKEDRTEEKQQNECAARGLEIKELHRILDVLLEADRTILYGEIKKLGKAYIDRGYITIEELEDIERMHSVYHDKNKLNGNGFLDNLMKAVRQLEKRVS